MSNKNLHLHILPIAIVGIGFFMVAVVVSLAGGFARPGLSDATTAAGKALTVHAVTITPKKDGLVSIKVNEDAAGAASVKNSANTNGLVDTPVTAGGEAGSAAAQAILAN